MTIRTDSIPAATRSSFWGRLRRLWTSAERQMAERRECRRLLGFSERELRDIGLAREDVEKALSRPFDPYNL